MDEETEGRIEGISKISLQRWDHELSDKIINCEQMVKNEGLGLIMKLSIVLGWESFEQMS